MASSAAKRYAQAVFSLGKERGTLDAWQGDLALLDSIVADDRIATYLTNPSVTAERKIDAPSRRRSTPTCNRRRAISPSS